MRRLLSNLLTSGATLALLAVLTLPASHVRRDGGGPAEAAVLLHADRAPAARTRTFGVYVDPWHIGDWARAVGGVPQMVAKFESFSRRRGIAPFLAEASHQGLHQALVSWEPWEPVPARLGITLQFLPQPGYRNAEIAAGAQDAYIRRFATSLKAFDGVVWLRYAHEMNGIWYPWSHGPTAYVRAWRHVVGLVRSIAPNARFVWSANPSLYEPASAWSRRLRRYWPGARWVDAVGSTVIDFGGQKSYPVARFVPRLAALRRMFAKRVMIAEANTDADGRVAWLRDFRQMLAGMPWITAVAWSQLPSRGTAQMRGGAGLLDWDVERDPPAAAQLAAIIRDGQR
jgi:mannan endo-1,4-beta-mannosidase